MGEGGRVVHTTHSHFMYQGGFMGNTFNQKLADFKILSKKKDIKVEYTGVLDMPSV